MWGHPSGWPFLLYASAFTSSSARMAWSRHSRATSQQTACNGAAKPAAPDFAFLRTGSFTVPAIALTIHVISAISERLVKGFHLEPVASLSTTLRPQTTSARAIARSSRPELRRRLVSRRGARVARSELEQTAERLGAPRSSRRCSTRNACRTTAPTRSAVARAWKEAFAATGPSLSKPIPNPEVPPLPPHITLKQAKAFASTLTKGDPREWGVIKETAKELLADLMPTRS